MTAAAGLAVEKPARTPLYWSALFKDAILAALVATLLALPLVGMQTYDIGGGALGIRTHFDWVATAAAAVFAGRLAWHLRPRHPRRAEAGGDKVFSRLATWSSRRTPLVAAAGIAFAVVLPFLPFSSRYLIDLGYVAFYAVGAYTCALLARDLGLTFWEALPFSGLVAAGFGVILGFPVLRLRGDYLAIVTLGFGEIIRIVLLNWSPVTGGPNGISDIPRPSFFGLPFARSAPEGVTTFHQFFGIEFSPNQRVVFLYLVILALALVTNLFTLRLRKLPIGRAWEALREDEIACRALGINPTNVKLSAFGIGAMLGGFAGSFFATRQGFISPESFTITESATILAIVVLGGMGSQMGVVLAAILLVTLPEFGRAFAEFRMLLFGAAMVAIMVWRPRGLLAHREPSLRLAPHESGGALR